LLLIILCFGVLIFLSAPRGSKAMLERKQFCQWPCKCRVKPQCAPGFSSVLDSCGCCKSCAQQIREACNERDICDPHKGMYCNFSKDQLRYEAGVCAYLMAVGCDLNGVHYENGEAFQPRSMYKCTCTIVYTLAFIPWPAVLLGPAPLRSNTSRKHQQDTTYMAAMDPPLVWMKNCLIQTTPWSPCSKTCGLGISVRVNNDNGKCEMRKDRCLSLLQPCEKSIMKNMQRGKRCKSKFQAKKAEKLTLSGCSITRSVEPTYCGICTDKRCCVHNKSKMVSVNFKCNGGSNVRWKMQWITSCVCQSMCDDPGDVFAELRFF
uniref:Cellular communication network factor 6 n=1 Tax=Oncorhynchus tshawytscha TaxID=74940 RepID=A0A8C8LSA0_ONCTS